MRKKIKEEFRITEKTKQRLAKAKLKLILDNKELLKDSIYYKKMVYLVEQLHILKHDYNDAQLRYIDYVYNRLMENLGIPLE
jgi:hypothetical protein